MLLQKVCGSCGASGPSPCEPCVATFHRAGEVPAPEPLSALWAAFRYDEATRGVICGLKYRNQRASAAWAARVMADALPQGLLVDAVTWAPTTPRRRHQRGFDQAELLARRLARLLGLPAMRLLSRGDDPPRTGRSRQQRRLDISFAPRGRVPAEVLLVDDVVTTGATLSAGSAVLLAAGAQRVRGVVVGCTPPGRAWRTHRPTSTAVPSAA